MTSENNSSQDTHRLMQYSPPPLISSRVKFDHQNYTLRQQSFGNQIKQLKTKDAAWTPSCSSRNIKEQKKTECDGAKAKCEVTVIGYENMDRYSGRDGREGRSNVEGDDEREEIIKGWEGQETWSKDMEKLREKPSKDLITPIVVSRNSLSLSTEQMQKDEAEYFRKSAYRSFEVAVSS